MEELLESNPENPRYLQARASALGSLGKEKEAAVTLDLLRRMGELKTSELIVLGDLYHNLNLYDLSLDAYQELWQAATNYPYLNIFGLPDTYTTVFISGRFQLSRKN